MKIIAYLLPILTLVFFACGQDQGQSTQNDSSNTQKDSTSNTSSFSKAEFEAKLQARANQMPLNLVAESGKLNPVDEAPKDTGFFLFREALLSVIEKKDLIELSAYLGQNMKVNFGGDTQGPAGFIDMWDLKTPLKIEQSKVWKKMADVLNLGGQFDNNGNAFYAPYVFTGFPDEYDAFKYSAITGSGVRLRSAPSINSKILKSLNYNIVEVLDRGEEETIGGETHIWMKVKVPNSDLEGFVYGKYLRSPIDYRIGFEKVDQNWQMSFFVAGD